MRRSAVPHRSQQQLDDEYWMRAALHLASQARDRGEVPVGAVLVRGSQQIGAGFNCPITTCDASAHAEIMALRDAARHLQNYRLPDSTVYVTLEPCMMCAGALVHARVAQLVYGAKEPKAGVVDSHPLMESNWLNHNLEIRGGVLADQCGAILSEFFARRRGEQTTKGGSD